MTLELCRLETIFVTEFRVYRQKDECKPTCDASNTRKLFGNVRKEKSSNRFENQMKREIFTPRSVEPTTLGVKRFFLIFPCYVKKY